MVPRVLQTPTPLSDIEAPPSGDLARPEVFARTDRAVEDWYWALPSEAIANGETKAVTLWGRALALYRGQDGVVRAVDAHCPHQGAHFGHGSVDGDNIVCPLHGWTFNSDGTLVRIPCQQGRLPVKIATWPVRERYGLIWVYTARVPRSELFLLDGSPRTAAQGAFEKACPPTVLLARAADEQYLNNRPGAGDGRLEIDDSKSSHMVFRGAVAWSQRDAWCRLFASFTAQHWAYEATLYGASAAVIRLQAGARRFHFLFAVRPTAEGLTEGRWIALDHGGLVAQRVARAICAADDDVFATLQWKFKTPTASDRPTLRLMKRIEKLPPIACRTWDLVRAVVPLSRAQAAAPALDEETVDTLRPGSPDPDAFEEPTAGQGDTGSGFENARAFAAAGEPFPPVGAEDAPAFEEDETRADAGAIADLIGVGGAARATDPGFEEPTRPDQTGG